MSASQTSGEPHETDDTPPQTHEAAPEQPLEADTPAGDEAEPLARGKKSKTYQKQTDQDIATVMGAGGQSLSDPLPADESTLEVVTEKSGPSDWSSAPTLSSEETASTAVEAQKRSEVRDSHDRYPTTISSAERAPLAPVPGPGPMPYPGAAPKKLPGKRNPPTVTFRTLAGIGALAVVGLLATALVTQPWKLFGPQPATFTVTGASAAVSPTTGACGGVSGPFTFEGVITVSPASGGAVQFHWERSDGASSAPETVTIPSGQTSATVHHPWVAPAPTHPGSYWGQLVVTAPNGVTSNQATFTMPQC
jgi:hypothetical protein